MAKRCDGRATTLTYFLAYLILIGNAVRTLFGSPLPASPEPAAANRSQGRE